MTKFGNFIPAFLDCASKSLGVLKCVLRPTHGKACLLFGFYSGIIVCAILSVALSSEARQLIYLFSLAFPAMLALWLFAWGEHVIDKWLGLR
jgi:hypothetical protein